MVSKTVLIAPARIGGASDLQFLWYPGEAGDQVEIDLSPLQWIGPLGVVALLARCMKSQENANFRLSVRLPDDAGVRTYLDRIGFFATLFGDFAATIDASTLNLLPDYEVRACVPVTKVVDSSGSEHAGRLLFEALRNQAPSEVIVTAFEAFVELTNNAREHGSACYVVAQTHSGDTSGTPGLHFAVADFGPGFKASLYAFNPSDEAHAMDLAFTFGISSRKSEPTPRGAGLAELLRSLDKEVAGSEFQILSRDTLRVRKEGAWETSTVPDCGGVFAAVYLPF